MTKQKTAILEYFKNHQDNHYTVEELHLSLLKDGSRVSVATLYRTVDSLAEKGFLRKYYNDVTQKASYQYVDDSRCFHHFHMICDHCGQVYHLDCDEASKFASHIENEHGFKIDFSKAIFYGTCKACLKKGKE